MSEQHLRPGPAQRPSPELGTADPDEGEPRNPWELREETGIARALLLPFTIPLVLWLLKLTGVFPIEPGAGP